MRTCPKCRSHSYTYSTSPIYGMVYICDNCKIEGEILIHQNSLLREVRLLSSRMLVLRPQWREACLK